MTTFLKCHAAVLLFSISIGNNFLVLDAQPILPFGDINVVVLTDVHGWLGGHGYHEPKYNIDYGDVLSFYEHLKAHCDDVMDGDLWFVNNGDWAHGTGLSAPGPSTALVPLLEKMPWDVLTCGNHELYEDSRVEYMLRPGGFVDWWGDRYLTANILRANENGRLLGYPYKILKGKKANLLVFGFLYNLENPSALIEIASVETVVQQKWFHDALMNESYDAIMVLAHMDMVDPLVEVIRAAIRKLVGETMPIQFITGHTHYRGVATLDDTCNSFEAGRYLDTVGFVSFPTSTTVSETGVSNATSLFQSVFIDANSQEFAKQLGKEFLPTPNGKDLAKFIENTRTKLGLLEEIGCAPKNYILNASLEDDRSIWKLFRDEVAPTVFFSMEDKNSSVMLVSQESVRYDLLGTTLIVDDLWAVAPFNDTLTYLGSYSGEEILKLNASINGNVTWYGWLPSFVLVGTIGDQTRDYKLYTYEFDAVYLQKNLEDIAPDKIIAPELTSYTSTMMWITYVQKYWACNEFIGKLPDWVPTPDHVTKKLGRDDDQTKRMVTIVLCVLLGWILCIVLALNWLCWLRYACGCYKPVPEDEVKAFDLGEEATKEQGDDAATLNDDDHELL